MRTYWLVNKDKSTVCEWRRTWNPIPNLPYLARALFGRQGDVTSFECTNLRSYYYIIYENTLINMKPKVMHTNPQRHIYIYRSYQNTQTVQLPAGGLTLGETDSLLDCSRT
jgi:hypothetical protein